MRTDVFGIYGGRTTAAAVPTIIITEMKEIEERFDCSDSPK
jgi:hypothetical protein